MMTTRTSFNGQNRDQAYMSAAGRPCQNENGPPRDEWVSPGGKIFLLFCSALTNSFN